jgi:hypothetical protein
MPRPDHLTAETHMPIGIHVTMGVTVKTAINGFDIQWKQVRTRSSKQFYGVPRRENHLFWDHL